MAHPRVASAVVLAALVAGGLSDVARAGGLTFPDAPAARVNDYASALPPGGRARLEEQIAGYTLGRSHQIVVAIFASLEGEALEDLSMRIAERWKVGSRKGDDGVLVTVFLAEHKLRVDVGYGLEGRLPDAAAGRIIRDTIAPRFKKNDVEGGLREGIAAINAAIVDGAGATEAAPAAPDHDLPWWAIGMFILLVGGMPLFLLYSFVRFIIRLVRGGPRAALSGWGGGSGGWSSGSGGFGSSSSSSSSSDSGWSGGGGGSFGGGGASGDW